MRNTCHRGMLRRSHGRDVALNVWSLRGHHLGIYMFWPALDPRRRTNRKMEIRVAFVLAPSVFGAVHLASWNIAHPTDIELWLWRGSIVACLVIPILFASVVYLRDAVVYRSACMHILVLAYFLSLRVLPSSVFDTVKWSSFVPHI